MNPNSKQKRIAFGYERLGNNKIVPHEGQAAALKLIYWMYAEGKSLAQIKDIIIYIKIYNYTGIPGLLF